MPGKHAVLSPSSSERWISCPASVRVVAKVPSEPESPYAAEGTAAHALGELKVREWLGKLTRAQYRSAVNRWRKEHAGHIPDEDEMQAHTDAYLQLVQERRAAFPDTQVLVEQRVDSGVPSCTGTADTILVSPVHVEIIDLKYGAGVPVNAEGNSQLRLYGVGALEGYGDLLGEPETVYMTVFQPRIGDGHAHTASMPAAELRAWRDSLIPVAQLALSDNAPFGPSEDACRWCPASGRCPAQLEKMTSLDFGHDIDLLTPEEMAKALEIVPQVREWLNALEVAALTMAYSEGEGIPGYKVVMSGGKRFVADPEGARKQLVELGYDEAEFVKETVVGIGELEKLVGKKNFDSVLGSFISKSTGKPSLVPVSDKRSAVNPEAEAAKEFEDVL